MKRGGKNMAPCKPFIFRTKVTQSLWCHTSSISFLGCHSKLPQTSWLKIQRRMWDQKEGLREYLHIKVLSHLTPQCFHPVYTSDNLFDSSEVHSLLWVTVGYSQLSAGQPEGSGGETISLPLPAASSHLHSLACGPSSYPESVSGQLSFSHSASLWHRVFCLPLPI